MLRGYFVVTPVEGSYWQDPERMLLLVLQPEASPVPLQPFLSGGTDVGGVRS